MTVYIASYFNTKERLLPYRDQLQKMGYVVASRWLTEPENKTVSATLAGYDEDYLRAVAARDLEDILTSEIFILDTLDVTERGGREVEFGVALRSEKRIYLVGPKRNVFHRLIPEALCFNTWEELLADFARRF